MYADDTTIYFSLEDFYSATNLRDTQIILNWKKLTYGYNFFNKLSFNVKIDRIYNF